MRKIALVSVWNHNYGSLLQTFAIQNYLNANGMQNEIIHYKDTNIVRKLARFANYTYLKAKLNIVYRDLKLKIYYPFLYSEIIIRSNKFENFKKNKLNFTEKIIGRKKLIKRIKTFDAVVLGSDQVWHPANLLMNYFTLSFVPDHIAKIAYAPSFGVSKIPLLQRNRTKAYLNRFNHISVREFTGQNIVKSLTNREVEIVCDPTLLIDINQWDLLKGNNRILKEKYILCYYLGNNPSHREFALNLKKATNHRIVCLQQLDEFIKSDITFGDLKPFDIDPADFLNLIAHAEYVLTDSFHATIFSILYNKLFFTFYRFKEGKSESTNTRITSILNQFNLNDRKLSGNEDVQDCLKRTIDHENVHLKLNEIKQSSNNYLQNSLLNI